LITLAVASATSSCFLQLRKLLWALL